MSYILDALKKSQAEQNTDGVSLRVQTSGQRHSRAIWIGAGLGIVLLFNAGLLFWIFVIDERPATTIISQPPQAQQQPDRLPASRPLQTQTQQQIRPRTPVQRPEQSSPQQPAIERLALTDLPTGEQTLYNGFRYSTHIYTDDPSLCAIVVDGQRLMEGDSFKGLSVVAITEQGVIFEERRRGQRRQVEVSILDQWDSN